MLIFESRLVPSSAKMQNPGVCDSHFGGSRLLSAGSSRGQPYPLVSMVNYRQQGRKKCLRKEDIDENEQV